MENNNNERLIKNLKMLYNNPSEKWKQTTLARLEILEKNSVTNNKPIRNNLGIFNFLYQMDMRAKNLLFTVSGIFLVLAFAGVLTVSAANGSKPGDSLFGLEKALEQVQRTFTFSNNAKTSLELDILHERLDELKTLSTDNIDDPHIEDCINELEEQEHKAELEYEKDKNLGEINSEIEKKYSEYIYEIQKYIAELRKELSEAQTEGDIKDATEIQNQITNMEQILQNPIIEQTGTQYDDSKDGNEDINNSPNVTEQEREQEEEQEQQEEHKPEISQINPTEKPEQEESDR